MKRFGWFTLSFGLAAYCSVALWTQQLLRAAPPGADQPTATSGVQPESATGAATNIPKPKWKVGDQWVIETATRPIQSRANNDQSGDEVRLKWRFRVTAVEKIAGRDAFRVTINSLDKQTSQPQTTIWVDQQTQVLRQVQTQLPVPEGFRTITESYSAGEHATPVFGPLTALPIDLPAFVAPGTKDLGAYEYEATSGIAGTKAIGEVSFAYSVQQTSRVAEVSRTKGLFDSKLIKDFRISPTVDVTLKTVDREVRQVWQADLPWAAYSNNGSTEARLVEVQRAAEMP